MGSVAYPWSSTRGLKKGQRMAYHAPRTAAEKRAAAELVGARYREDARKHFAETGSTDRLITGKGLGLSFNAQAGRAAWNDEMARIEAEAKQAGS